ncbi:restriction endonuclease subunit S domain-containing protein [Clostridium felsineum]|uniref:Uncharacterized protein n=1 Tax=Clostridium felsineum TaxID=36839 RepID=A0A1S8L7F0_9CLOT|nr:restriction endonuclease subunit S [Clostridium felsineum]URZ07085.1 hypothetical protein CLROS_024180 [Clostridium felsineum]URZ12115.1 hypothetical protein CROST_028320 [Clostridium felsineum]
MDKNNNKPKLRFPGFTEPWEQCKLSELLFPADERNNAGRYTQNDVLAASLGTELVKKHIFFGLRSTEESVKNYRVVNSGDVIYTKSPIKGYPNGIIRTNKGLDGIVPSLYCVYHSISSINSGIIQSYFEDNSRLDAYLYPLVNIGARNNVNITDIGFLEGTICISQDIDEQNKIVTFFNHLTNLITLHQRKLKHLKDKKKGLLQKMFPKNGESFPELRFPGFTDAWEQRKLGEIAERIIRKNTELKSTLPLTISAQYGLVDQITFFNKRVASRDVSGYYLLKKGEFAYNKSYSEGYPWGTIKRLERYENGALSTLYICFKLLDVNSDFLVSYYETDNWHKEIAQRAAEGARNHGLLNISADDFFDTKLTIPKSKEEQSAIGCFFQEFDNLITLHQRKLDHLQQQKKALLQQMFV